MTTDTPIPMPKRARMSRGVRAALFASLALNALFIGGLISAFVRHGGPVSLAAANMPNNLGAYVSTLPAERGRALWNRAGDRRRIMMPLRQEVRLARRDALATLTAEPFDRERFVAAQNRLIDAEHRLRLAQRDTLAEIASGLTVEERRAYIRWRGPMRGASQQDDAETPPAPK